MVNLLEWHRRRFGLRVGRRVLQFAALSFDVAFQETFSTVCSGGTLVLLDESVRRDVTALMGLMQESRIERLFVPPLMLQSLAEYSAASGTVPHTLQDVITAGEQLRLSPEIVEFFERLPSCRLHNHYGPTETHVVTALTLPASTLEWPAIPTIGKPISNTQIHILDERRRLVPVGVIGEIFIGGVALARGYLDRPDLTAARFVTGETDDGRLYRTGDLGRWRTDGNVEFLGRNDDQVKIRGYRVELGEIETQLVSHASVRDAAVLARGEGTGEKRIVAYVTSSGTSVADPEELRVFLKGLLPEYMVPSAYVVLDTLPLTPNGKLDRKALPAPGANAHSNQQWEAPEGPLEGSVSQVFQDVLQVDRVGRRDHFFELGGHSLLAIKALVRINQTLDASLTVADLYRHPTVVELTARLSKSGVEDELIDLAREAQLDPGIAAIGRSRRVPAGNIFLTGATGFVGRFLVAELLQETSATLHCLIRARSKQEAASRLKSVLTHWDLWRPELESRLVAIPGDLRTPRLGIDHITYRDLSRRIDSIYH